MLNDQLMWRVLKTRGAHSNEWAPLVSGVKRSEGQRFSISRLRFLDFTGSSSSWNPSQGCTENVSHAPVSEIPNALPATGRPRRSRCRGFLREGNMLLRRFLVQTGRVLLSELFSKKGWISFWRFLVQNTLTILCHRLVYFQLHQTTWQFGSWKGEDDPLTWHPCRECGA